MNLWIDSSYTHRFKIMDIKLSDIVPFLKHVDCYPTRIVSINSLECELIEYFNIYEMNDELISFLKEISMRYGLKKLYLYVHNRFVLLQKN